jgi:hypothetical protein
MVGPARHRQKFLESRLRSNRHESSWLAAAIKKFHGGQTFGEYYRPSGIYHSLGARGGRHDANGNRVDKDGNIVGYDGAWYGGGRPDVNPFTGRPYGTWPKPITGNVSV